MMLLLHVKRSLFMLLFFTERHCYYDNKKYTPHRFQLIYAKSPNHRLFARLHD